MATTVTIEQELGGSSLYDLREEIGRIVDTYAELGRVSGARILKLDYLPEVKNDVMGDDAPVLTIVMEIE